MSRAEQPGPDGRAPKVARRQVGAGPDLEPVPGLESGLEQALESGLVWGRSLPEGLPPPSACRH